MAKKQSREDDLDLYDDFHAAGDVDIDDLIATIHSAELFDPPGARRRHRSARRRLEDMSHDRELREALMDWDEYEDDYEFGPH